MAKKKEMDKLSQEVSMALASGMSYGKWKALQEPVKIEPKQPKEYFIRRICVVCKSEFISFDNRNRVVCGEKCRKLLPSERQRQKQLERKKQNA